MQNTDRGYIKLSYIDINNKFKVDSCKLKNGKFLFKGRINGVALSSLSYNSNPKSSFSDEIIIFLEENLMKLKISKNFKFKNIQGSNTQNEWVSLNKTKVYKQIDSLHKGINLPKFNKNENLKAKYKELQKEIIIYDYRYAKERLSSYLSPYLLSNRFERREIGIDSINLIYEKLTPKIKKSSFGIELGDKIQMRKSSSINQIAPDFVKNDINGSPIKLSSFRDKKYVLLDFSASWCLPCKEQLPKLKELYEKYNKKDLDIIVISWDFDDKAWKTSVEKEGIMNWYNVSGFFNPKGDGLRSVYSISNIPTLILIDKKGIIIGRFDNNGKKLAIDDLEEKLGTIFPQD